MTPQGAVTIFRPFQGQASHEDVKLAQAANGDVYGVLRERFFRLTPEGGALVLRNMGDVGIATDGLASIVSGSDGNFYVTADQPTPSTSRGVVVRLTPSGALTVIYLFQPETSATGLVEASDGRLYGVSLSGARTVFRLTRGGVHTRLHQFSYWDGEFPTSVSSG